MTGTVYGYGRESTSKQEKSGLGRAHQIKALREYATRLPQPFYGTFMDSAVSGSVVMTDRPEGAKLDRLVQRGDIICVTRLDRAFRKTADALRMVERWESLGVHFHCVDFGGNTLNFMTPVGKFILTILVAFAELEREYARERTRAAMLIRQEKYGTMTTGSPPMGYQWQGKGTKRILVADEEQMALMRQMYDWYAEDNVPVEQIRQHLMYNLKIPNRWGKDPDVWKLRACYVWIQKEFERRVAEAKGDPEAFAELIADDEEYVEQPQIIIPNQFGVAV